MDIFEALYTTRAMRRVKPDPIPEDVQKAILDAAIRAPTGGNAQNWRFMLVDDPGMKGELGPLYRECLEILWGGFYKERIDAAEANPDDAEGAQFLRVKKSADCWATTSSRCRSSSSRSAKATLPAARSSRPCGTRCSRRVPTASARR